MSEKYSRNHNTAPNYKLRRAIAAGALLLTAGVGIKAFADEGPSREQKLVEAVQSNEQQMAVRNGTVILREGVNLRTAPDMKRADGAMGQADNVERTVAAGKAIVAERPVSYIDEKGNEWIGFTMADKQVDDKVEAGQADASEAAGELADRLNWVNLTELSDQRQSDGEPFYEYTPQADDDIRIINTEIKNGQFWIEGDQTRLGNPVAVAQEVAAEHAYAVNQ